MDVIERRRKRVYFRGQIKLDLCRDWSYTHSFNMQVLSSSAYKCCTEKGFTKCEKKGVLSMFLENLASASGVLSAP